MKNLIGLFFLIGSLSAYAQNTNKDVVAENRPVLIKTKNRLPEDMKNSSKDEKIQVVTNIKTDILAGFQSGKADLLAKYFPANIDINVLGKSNLYSKSQAKQVLTTFFTKNSPSNFKVVHEGQSNGTKYFIGTYTSSGKDYRVTVNVKTVAGVEKISSISIER
ncbi:MAG: DUF4783 domain-containing protein [Crocinitomicaceae bacterium]